MSKVKLVIEIEHNEYTGIKNFPDGTTSYPWTLHLYDAVRNGTPLDEYMVKAEKENFIQTCEVFRERIDEV